MNIVWYESRWFIALVSSLITILTFIIGQYLSRKYQKENDKKNTLILITQSNSSLFSLIYRGSLNEDNIDYIKLREELTKTNVIFILPEDLKDLFQELYKIHFSGPEYYDKNKVHIHNYLKKIVELLNAYGVETFGY